MEDNSLVGIFVWVVGVLVALAVGSGMIRANTIANTGLWITGIPDIIVSIAGWVVVVGAVLSVILAVFKK